MDRELLPINYTRSDRLVDAFDSGGIYYLSTINNNAFFFAPEANFSQYMARDLNSKPFRVIITDNIGKVAHGFIGQKSNVGTLGVTIITDGDMETDPTNNWTPSNAILAEEGDIVQAGLKSLKVTDNGGGAYCYQQFNTDIGKLYKVGGYVWNDGGNTGASKGKIIVESVSPTVVFYIFSSSSSDEWENTNFYFTATTVLTNIKLVPQTDTGDITYFDTVTVQEVTDPSPNKGIKIYDDITGDVQSFLSIEENGFNPNNIDSWEIIWSYGSEVYIPPDPGTSWTITSSLNQAKKFLAGCGTISDALCFGGDSGVRVDTTEIWNGSSWTNTSSLNQSKFYLDGCGTISDALCFGGDTGANTDTTEIWNGSSWTTTSSLNQIKYALAGCGTTSDALCFGGDSGVNVDTTEIWNGSSWATTSSLNEAKRAFAGYGTISDALCFGGYTDARVNTTEIWS